MEKPASNLNLSALLILLVVTIASTVGINAYSYGTHDTIVSIPILIHEIDPALYPGDSMVAQSRYFYTYFWKWLAQIIQIAGVDLPVLFFAGYIATLFATFLVLYLIAMRLFQERAVAFGSIFLLVFPILSLGWTPTIDSHFLTRSAVLPLLLYAIYLFLHRKFFLAFVALGIGFLFHALTAFYATAILFFTALCMWREIGLRTLVTAIVAFAACISPLLFWKFKYPAPDLHVFYADPSWVSLMKSRLPQHVFPSTWPALAFVKAALFVTGFVLTWRHKPDDYAHRVIFFFTIAVAALCLAGTVFSEIFPVSLVLQFQLFRSFPFLIYIGVLYFVNFIFKEQDLRLKALAVLLVLPIFHDSVAQLVAVAVILSLILFFYHQEKLLPYFPAAVAAVLLLAGFAGAYMKGGFSIQSRQESKWRQVQKWAKKNTARADVFIVPPATSGFRVESRRTIYADWKDANHLFTNPAFGQDWLRRMKRLGNTGSRPDNKNFKRLKESDFVSIASELGDRQSVFLVMPADRSLSFPERFSNQKYRVYEVAKRP